MKFGSYVFFFLLFGVCADVLLCFTLLQGTSLSWKLLAFIPTIAAGACLPFIHAGKKYAESLHVLSYLMFIFLLPKFFAAVFGIFLSHSFSWGIGAGVSLFFLFFIFYASRNLQVKETTLSFENLPPSFDGIKLCHISDIHLGSFGEVSPYVDRVVDTVLSGKPDIIFFSGDLVNFETREAFPYDDVLSRLKAPLGIFSCMGNHDFLLHGPHDDNEQDRLADMKRLDRFERELGWRVLRNENTTVKKADDSITVIGVDNITANPYFREVGGNLSKAMEGVDEKAFKILMSHDPTHWRMEVLPNTNIDLTLSGHTHGLKYKFAGFDPSHWRLHESGGIYTEGKQVLNVSEGLGSAFAFRLGGFPKIDLITLTKA